MAPRDRGQPRAPRGVVTAAGVVWRPRPERRRRPPPFQDGGCMGTAAETAIDIRPFQVDVPQEKLDELSRRIEATRWPSKELVDDRSQGVSLATTQALARFWTKEYDWRRCEARLNALPQFMTEIDGVDIQFIHVRSPHEGAVTLIMK